MSQLTIGKKITNAGELDEAKYDRFNDRNYFLFMTKSHKLFIHELNLYVILNSIPLYWLPH